MSDEESTCTEDEITDEQAKIMLVSVTKCAYFICLTNEIKHEFGANFWMKEGSVEQLDGLLKFYNCAQKALRCDSVKELMELADFHKTFLHAEEDQPLMTDLLKKDTKNSTSA